MELKKDDTNWKQDPHIQALVAERVQQVESDARSESLHSKRKKSGCFNITDSSNSVSYHRWDNESIFVGPVKCRVVFDNLTPLQFCLGYVKDVNDKLDSLTCQHLMAELFEIQLHPGKWQKAHLF